MRFEIESKSWFHFLLCQHNASGAIMQVVNMSSGAIHLKTNTYISYMTVHYKYINNRNMLFCRIFISQKFLVTSDLSSLVFQYFKFRA